MCEINNFVNEFLQNFNDRVTETDDDDKIQYMNRILDELNAFSASKNIPRIENLEEIILKISNNVFPKQHCQLFVKFCHLIYNLLTNQQVQLSRTCLEHLLKYLLNSLEYGRQWIIPDILNTVSSVLYGNIGHLEKFWDKLIGPNSLIIEFVQDVGKDFEIRVSALKCLQSICIKRTGENFLSEDHLKTCLRVFLESLQSTLSNVVDVTDISSAKILCASLRGMQNILLSWKNTPIDNVGELLGTIRVLLFYGLKGGSPIMYQCLYPSPVCQFIPQFNADATKPHEKSVSNRKKSRKKRANTQKGGKAEVVVDCASNSVDSDCSEGNPSVDLALQFGAMSLSLTARPSWNCTSSSDSEYSDSEMANTTRIRHTLAKVRYSAYNVMQAINFSVEKRVMFGFWSSFIPDIPGPSTASQGLTVLMTILKDPSPQVRGAAVSFLADLLLGSKLFLGIADESATSRTSFISMSATLASVIRELHRGLMLAIVAENSSTLITQLLKCYSVLVSNVPYHRLKPGLLINIVKHIQPLFNHKDVQVRVACFTLLSCIVHVRPFTDELLEIIEGNFNSNLKSNQMNGQGKTWLLDICYQNIFGSSDEWNRPISTQVAALQLLTAFVSGYFTLVRPCTDSVEQMIFTSLKHSDPSIQLTAAKALDALGKCILEENEKDDGMNKTEWLDMWIKLLRGPLPACLQTNNSSLRTVGCDCMSSIGGYVFNALPKDLQILCLTLVLGLTKDDDCNVCGAAIRCLGVFCLYPCLQEVVIFLVDTGEAVVSLIDDSNFATSLKASWALGNLSDALRLKKQYLLDELPMTFIYDLGKTSMKAAQMHSKIQANAVRALGNILYYLPLCSIEVETVTLVQGAIACLLSKLGKTVVKVQWNACYALSTMLQNEDLISSSALNLNAVFESLLGALEKTNNFKVGINCVCALTVLSSRKAYKNYYSKIWSALLTALKSTERNVDFRELKHRDSFVEQICCSFTKLVCIMDIRDIKEVDHVTATAEEQLIACYQRLGMTAKECQVKAACTHLTLHTQNGVGEKSITFLKKLIFILESYFNCLAPEESNVA